MRDTTLMFVTVGAAVGLTAVLTHGSLFAAVIVVGVMAAGAALGRWVRMRRP